MRGNVWLGLSPKPSHVDLASEHVELYLGLVTRKYNLTKMDTEPFEMLG